MYQPHVSFPLPYPYVGHTSFPRWNIKYQQCPLFSQFNTLEKCPGPPPLRRLKNPDKYHLILALECRGGHVRNTTRCNLQGYPEPASSVREKKPQFKTKCNGGAPGWLSRVSVRLGLRSRSHSSWVQGPHQALC